MTLFPHAELKEAFAFAENGGQSLLLGNKRGTARLIDHDTSRLIATARHLGARWPGIERGGKPGQNWQIGGHMLQRAINETRQLELA
jgi:hypothetical protein